MKILVTGTAGFIGFHLAKRLLDVGHAVVGIDNINDYYDVNLKYARLAETGISKDAENWNTENQSTVHPEYRFIRMNLEDKDQLFELFKQENFDYVVNLAAQAGVRYSLENPDAYIQSNIVGFMNILEACRNFPVKHFIYASSSSVYGANAKTPFSETDQVDNPVSLYAATKKSNELMAHTYSHLYNIPTTGLRFFTVYGPWGRPDMAPILFASAIKENHSIKVFNNGNMERDFTYIDDIVEGITRLLEKSPSQFSPQGELEGVPYRILNIGNGLPVNLLQFIKTMEDAMGKEAEKNMMPIQPGDVKQTWADTKELEKIIEYRPQIDIKTGVQNFVKWFKVYYG